MNDPDEITTMFARLKGYCPAFMEDVRIIATKHGVTFLPLEEGDLIFRKEITCEKI